MHLELVYVCVCVCVKYLSDMPEHGFMLWCQLAVCQPHVSLCVSLLLMKAKLLVCH